MFGYYCQNCGYGFEMTNGDTARVNSLLESLSKHIPVCVCDKMSILPILNYCGRCCEMPEYQYLGRKEE